MAKEFGVQQSKKPIYQVTMTLTNDLNTQT